MKKTAALVNATVFCDKFAFYTDTSTFEPTPVDAAIVLMSSFAAFSNESSAISITSVETCALKATELAPVASAVAALSTGGGAACVLGST